MVAIVHYVLAVTCWMAVDQGVTTVTKLTGARKPKVVATRLDQVDRDFSVQGEYTGCVSGAAVGSCCPLTPFGLQVMALGGGQFQARGFVGGLPGIAPAATPVLEWQGKRAGDVVELVGKVGKIVLHAEQAQLFDSAGLAAGQLAKVERQSTMLGARPPAAAVVLFDGTDLSNLVNGKRTDDGNLAVGAMTRMPVKDFRMHVEFRVPYMPYARGQARGNSGLYLQRRYEVQVLDSFGLPAVFNGCAALYRQQTPRINMSLPPLTWQTYDIWFTAARWDALGNKLRPARITVWHNGVPVHCNQVIVDKTGAGQKEGPDAKPILFQNHGTPVAYRNVWLVPLDASPTHSATRRSGPVRRWLQRHHHARRR